jgi:hypothetical protein
MLGGHQMRLLLKFLQSVGSILSSVQIDELLSDILSDFVIPNGVFNLLASDLDEAGLDPSIFTDDNRIALPSIRGFTAADKGYFSVGHT